MWLSSPWVEIIYYTRSGPWGRRGSSRLTRLTFSYSSSPKSTESKKERERERRGYLGDTRRDPSPFDPPLPRVSRTRGSSRGDISQVHRRYEWNVRHDPVTRPIPAGTAPRPSVRSFLGGRGRFHTASRSPRFVSFRSLLAEFQARDQSAGRRRVPSRWHSCPTNCLVSSLSVTMFG